MNLIHKGTFDICMFENGMVSPKHDTAKWADRVFGTYEASKPLVPEVLDRAIWRMVVQQAQRIDGENMKLFYSLDPTIEIKLTMSITKGIGRPKERKSYKDRKSRSEKLYGHRYDYGETRIAKYPINNQEFKTDILRMLAGSRRKNTSNRNILICAIIEKALPLIRRYGNYYWIEGELRDWTDRDWEAAAEDIRKLIGTSDASKVRHGFLMNIVANKPIIPQIP